LKLKLYQVDAFTDRVFGGNPAAVIPLASLKIPSLALHIVS
jgi:predicted PhzF superfamily epimerase YddE/YHI9